MSDPWITDCQELLELRNGGREVPERSRDLAHRFGLIVSVATARREAEAVKTPLSCPCNDGSGSCKGPVTVGRGEGDEITWACVGCGSEGVIRCWKTTPWDLSTLVKERSGRPRRNAKLTAKQFAALDCLDMLEEGAELALRSVHVEGKKVVLSAVCSDLAELILAAETASEGACPCEKRALRGAVEALQLARSGRKKA